MDTNYYLRVIAIILAVIMIILLLFLSYKNWGGNNNGPRLRISSTDIAH